MPGTGPSRGWRGLALFQCERFSICYKMKKCHHRVTSCGLVKSQDEHLWVSGCGSSLRDKGESLYLRVSGEGKR